MLNLQIVPIFFSFFFTCIFVMFFFIHILRFLYSFLSCFLSLSLALHFYLCVALTHTDTQIAASYAYKYIQADIVISCVVLNGTLRVL